MDKKPLTNKEFKNIFSKVPRLCVDLIIVQENKFLLTKRSIEPLKGLWHFPGGTVRYGEKIEDAIERIAKDELGVKIDIIKFLKYSEGKSGYRHDVPLIFKCRFLEKDELNLSQASEAKFFREIPKNTIDFQEKFLKENWEKIFET